MNEMPSPEVLRSRMNDFMRFCASGNGSTFSLEGPVNVPTRFDTFVALMIETPSLEEVIVAVGDDNSRSQIELYSEVIGLKVPKRLERLRIPHDPAAVTLNKVMMALNGMPYLMLAFGKTDKREEKATYLFSVGGVNPSTGLEVIKDRASARMARNN